MCGIVGYVGKKQVVPLIIDGLRKLEYRGYDSAGIAVVDEHHELQIRRAEGKLRNLEEVLRLKPIEGTYCVGHTRLATHVGPHWTAGGDWAWRRRVFCRFRHSGHFRTHSRCLFSWRRRDSSDDERGSPRHRFRWELN